MATTLDPSPISVADILGRVFAGSHKPMSLAAARYFANADFCAKDKARMTELAARNQKGELGAPELAELRQFAQADCLLGVLQSRARRRLRSANPKSR